MDLPTRAPLRELPGEGDVIAFDEHPLGPQRDTQVVLKVHAHQLGVEQIILPQPGPRSPKRMAYEKQSWFRKGLYFRNGIEGRISVVKRTVQLRRCPAHGLEGFERWVGMGILVANMVIIARALYKRRHRKRRNVKIQI